jgi:hypothetical protein
MTDVIINAASGIEPLMARGRLIARTGQWGEARASNALIGLWLSNHVTRGQLRETITFLGGAESLHPQAIIELESPLGGARKTYDDAIEGAWRALGSLVPPKPHAESIVIDLASDTGVIPLAGWAAVSVAIVRGVVIAVAIWQVKELVEGWLARHEASSQVAKDAEELDRLAQEHIEREQSAGAPVPLDPITAAKVKAITDRQRLLVERATAGGKKDDGQSYWPLAAAAVAGLVLAVVLKGK